MNINFINHARAMMMMIHTRYLMCLRFMQQFARLFAQKQHQWSLFGRTHEQKVIYLIVYKIIISCCLIKCFMLAEFAQT